jgi:hypothetical protein
LWERVPAAINEIIAAQGPVPGRLWTFREAERSTFSIDTYILFSTTQLMEKDNIDSRLSAFICGKLSVLFLGFVCVGLWLIKKFIFFGE